MARYDSPGYQNQLPGFAPRPAHDYLTAPGSPPMAAGAPDAAQTVPHPGPGQAWIVPSGASTVNGDMVTVGVLDTEVSAQAALYSGPEADPWSGLPGELFGHTGAGTGSVAGPHHPNARPGA
jgi:hypothetical protein